MNKAGNSEAGFTLIELMVALAIFALISVAGVMLLRSGSDTQIAVKKRLEEMSLSHRLSNGLEGDLAQAMVRPVRDQSGQPIPAFTQGDADVPGRCSVLCVQDGQISMARQGPGCNGWPIFSKMVHSSG